MGKSLLKLIQLRKAVAGDLTAIERVDEEVVVLDLDVGGKAIVEGCHDFI